MKTRSYINKEGKVVMWRQQNYSGYESCCCAATSFPPCGFCENTGECDKCGHIYSREDIEETSFGLECVNCRE